MAAVPPEQAGGSSPSQQQWWSRQFAYRQNITISNPTGSALSNFPVFLLVDFPFSHLSDATAELRLVNQAQGEVLSYVLDSISSKGFVTSAWMLAFVSVPKSSSETFELYYGSPSATAPIYRISSATANAQAKDLSVSVSPSQPGASSLVVTLGGTYTQQILSKVSYLSGTPQDYGAGEISQIQAPVISGLSLVANVSSSVVALSSVHSAGALRYTQALLLDNDTLVNARLLTNAAETSLTGTVLTDFVDSTSLAALGPLGASYNSTSGVLTTAVAGAYFGYSSDSKASSFEIGARAQVIVDARIGVLSNSVSGAGAGAALNWKLGSLASGASTQLVSVWAVGRSRGELATSLQQSIGHVKPVVGQEESSSATVSQVTSSWNVAIPIANANVTGAGLVVPVALNGASAIASRIILTGTVRYVLPTGYESTSGQVGWVPQTAQTGNVGAFSTTAFYSIQENSYADSVRVTSGNGVGSGAAQLVSPVLSFPGSVTKYLILRYKAAFSGGGDLSTQWLYAAVDAGQASVGPFTQTLVVPAGGSSPSSGGSGCEALPWRGAPTSSPDATVTTSGALVADGSWRSLNVSLDHALGTSSLFARMRFCASVGPGYAGQLELDVSQAGIEAKGDAPSYLSASFPPGGSGVTLSFIPGATYEPSTLTLEGTVSFPAVGTTPLKWDGGTSYNATIKGLLPGNRPNSTANVGQKGSDKASGTPAATPFANATFVGATVSPPPYSLLPKILVNGSAVKGQPMGNLFFLKPSDIVGKGAATFRVVDVALTFAGYQLGLKVQDADGHPLPHAGITIQGTSLSPKNETATDATGLLSVLLLPSTYDVIVKFQGVKVGTATANLTSDQALTVPTDVYSIPLHVKNSIGGPVEGANITVSSGSMEFKLTSDGSGKASFLGVPNKEYNVSVSIAGSTYYTGTILGSLNRATFELGTSFLPASIQITIVAAITGSMVAASLVVYFARRRPKGY